MSKKKPKFYVVWEGHCIGVFTSWAECQKQINGYPKAVYKSFSTRAEAEKAFKADSLDYIGKDVKKEKKYPSAAVIMQVFKRDKFTCVYCGIPGQEAELQCDHIHPISKGGSNNSSNLRTSCRKCNQAKGDKLDFKYSNMTSTKQENTYYFRYKKEWYKTESNLKDETLIVTGIDPLKYEYKTKLLKIEDKSNIDFYADFEELLIDYDTESWNNDIINGSLLDHHERNFHQMRYLRMLNPDDVFYQKVSEDKELSIFMLKEKKI